jgi:hypothetical protein
MADGTIEKGRLAADTSRGGEAPAKFARGFLLDREVEEAAEAARARVLAEIDRLNLVPHVAALEMDGYTVLSPEETGAAALLEPLMAAILRISEARLGVPVDVVTGDTHRRFHLPTGQVQWETSLLLKDPVFERALMNPPALALVTYLLGESCIISHLSSMVKGPGDDYLPLHTDQNQSGAIPPAPPYAQVANATWALTDYSRDNGGICFVPGSHRYCRQPTHAEATDLSLFHPLEVRAGSIIVWHGNTWHGAFPRCNPGVRVSLVEYFSRSFLRPTEDLGAQISPEALARNPPRFAVLTGAAKPMKDFNSPLMRASRVGLFV